MQIKTNHGFHNTCYCPDRDIKFIVIHYTAGITSKSGAAFNVSNWFKNEDCSCSSDYIVDDTTIVQYNGDIDNRYTWHCGGERYNNKGGKLYGICTNVNSIGIEVCCNNKYGVMTAPYDGYSFSNETINNLITLVRALMDKYDIPINNVVRHYDTTGKHCPGVVGWTEDSGNNSEWLNFLKRVEGSAKYDVYIRANTFKTRESAERFVKAVNPPDYIIKERIE